MTKARRRAQEADVVIVNHHLFFADLALRSAWPNAQLLPAYEAVIFDEAHQLEDVVTDFFGVTVSTLRLLSLDRDVARAVAKGDLARAPPPRPASTCSKPRRRRSSIALARQSSRADRAAQRGRRSARSRSVER